MSFNGLSFFNLCDKSLQQQKCVIFAMHYFSRLLASFSRLQTAEVKESNARFIEAKLIMMLATLTALGGLVNFEV